MFLSAVAVSTNRIGLVWNKLVGYRFDFCVFVPRNAIYGLSLKNILNTVDSCIYLLQDNSPELASKTYF